MIRKILICLLSCLCLVSVGTRRVDAQTEIGILLPYTQHFVNDSIRGDVDSTVQYQLTPKNGAPMPAGSENNTYYFDMNGESEGDIRFDIAYQHPDYYSYEVRCAKTEDEGGYRYDHKVYEVVLTIVNSESGGLECGSIVISDSNEQKYDSVEFNVRYWEPRPTVPVPAVVPQPYVPRPVLMSTPVVPEVIEPEETKPEETPAVTVPENEVPQGTVEEKTTALLNLICMILTDLLAILAVFFCIRRDEEEEDEEVHQVKRREKRKIFAAAGCVIIGIVSVIVYALTEDLTRKMVWTDEYTIWMAIMLVMNVILTLLSKGKEETREEAE